ncbi:hypothetical protein BY996DRAFT_6513461 [Phakopsora pachyrhizi]|nr:hypothetical protein BY996DRAFT_6513461 [Phakopsora pachyrhizi]
MIPPINCGAKDKDPIQLEISKSLTHGRAPTYIQNPDQLQLLAEPNEDNHKGKLNKNKLIAVNNVTLPFIMPYEDEVDEFNDRRNNLSNLRGGYLDNHGENNNKMIKEDIEQESLPGATTTTREDSISKMIVTDVIELILKMIKEEDSFVYLNPIKAFFCKLTEKYPGEICDWLNLIYESLKDQYVDREKAASKLENDNGNDVIEWDKRLINKKLRVEEAMVLIIQRAGKSIKWGKELNGSKYTTENGFENDRSNFTEIVWDKDCVETATQANDGKEYEDDQKAISQTRCIGQTKESTYSVGDVKKPNMKSEIGIQGPKLDGALEVIRAIDRLCAEECWHSQGTAAEDRSRLWELVGRLRGPWDKIEALYRAD